MTPYKYTINNGITTFHYRFSELREFVSAGLKDGNVGMILTNREGSLITYKGFGTIENPMRKKCTLSMVHIPIMDGEMPTDDQMLIPPKPFFTSENSKLIIFDMSKIDRSKLNL